jgi:hypothetical protein
MRTMDFLTTQCLRSVAPHAYFRVKGVNLVAKQPCHGVRGIINGPWKNLVEEGVGN